MESKKELRKEIHRKRLKLNYKEQERNSNEIYLKVVHETNYMAANKILLYSPREGEVDTVHLFKAANAIGKKVYYPKVMGDKMEFYRVDNLMKLYDGYMGSQEPIADGGDKFIPKPGDKVCVIMPGIAFDEEGNRLGYGGGYYDKFLAKLETEFPRENICKIAIAFECQVIETGRIQRESHDIRPDYIVTEERIISV